MKQTYRKSNPRPKKRARYNNYQPKVVYKVPTPEQKGMDTVIGYADIAAVTNTNGYATCLNLVQSGTGSWNRVGRKIKMKSLRLTGYLQIRTTVDAGVAAPYPGVIPNTRLVIVYDQQPSSGAIPSFDTVFGHTEQDGTEASKYSDPLRFDNMDRFRVLRDMNIFPPSVPLPAINVASVSELAIDEYIKLNVGETVYSGQSNPMTIADISTGSLYVYARTSSNTDYTIINLELNARLRYTDI